MFLNLKKWFLEKSPNHYRQQHYSFDGKVITADGLPAKRTEVRIENLREVGIETTDKGPFIEDVFWLINRETEALRIPQDSPVFELLMDYFGKLESFDWAAFSESMGCTDHQYFVCWKRPT